MPESPSYDVERRASRPSRVARAGRAGTPGSPSQRFLRIIGGSLTLAAALLCAGCGGGPAPSPNVAGGPPSGGNSTYNNLDANALPPGFNAGANAAVNKNVQTAGGWQICVGSCANAATPASYMLTQNVASPSLNQDGQAAAFYQTGTPFGGVLWYNHFGNSSATHFIVDFYLLIDHPENAQAIEFAALKNDGTIWYKMEAQCDYQSGRLRGFNEQSFQWNDIGAKCVAPKANTWQRITLQTSTTGGTSNYEAVSFDGVLQPLSAALAPASQSNPAQLIGVHFQLDNADTNSGYTAYLDDWSLYSW